MKPGEVAAVLGSLFVPALVLTAVAVAPRACEVAGGLLFLVAAARAGGEVVRGRPDSPLGRRGALWVTTLFGTIGAALLAWGFFPATFLAAGYISLTLFGLAAFTRREVWGDRADARSGRFILLVLGLFAAAYAGAGSLEWSPADEVDTRSFAAFPGPVLVVTAALWTAVVGTAVWYRGLELRGNRWVRNGWTKCAAVGLFGLAAAIAAGGITLLSLVR